MSNKLKCFCPFNLSSRVIHTAFFRFQPCFYFFTWRSSWNPHTHNVDVDKSENTRLSLVSSDKFVFNRPMGAERSHKRSDKKQTADLRLSFWFFSSFFLVFFSHELSRFYERSKGLVRFSYKKIQEVIEEGEDALGEEMYFSKEGGEKGVP